MTIEINVKFSAKFDLVILAPYLFTALRERYGQIDVLKKENKYFSITTPDFIYKDALLFTSPCSLSKYLKQNDVSEKKSIFPYTYFNKIEELDGYLDFPPHSAFFSELRGSNVSETEYTEARNEFQRRKNLPDSDSEHLRSMRGWLKYYNELDTIPLAHAINNSFKNYFDIFGIDPSFYVSLPKFAQMCMFRSYDPSEPLCFSFRSQESEIQELFRQHLTGGLVNAFHRMIE